MLAVLAVQDAEPEQRTEYLWPDNVDTWGHWRQVQTQWRAGMSGATGLDYAGVSAYLTEQGIQPGTPERQEIFEGLRAAEQATLEVWSEQAAKTRQEQNQKG